MTNVTAAFYTTGQAGVTDLAGLDHGRARAIRRRRTPIDKDIAPATTVDQAAPDASPCRGSAATDKFSGRDTRAVDKTHAHDAASVDGYPPSTNDAKGNLQWP